MNSIIEFTDVSKDMDGQRILGDVNLSIRKGAVHGLIGSNGAGKTSLLRLMNGVYRPTTGVVHVFGAPLPPDAAEIRQRVHLVSADGGFYPSFRVIDLLHYSSMIYAHWDEARCAALIKALELPLHQPTRKLSLGMKMQLRIAIALSSRPSVLLLDEPTNGLDPIVRRQFLQLIVQEVAGSDMTVVMATHRLDELEAIADEMTVLNNGRVILSGQLETLKGNYREIIVVSDDGSEPIVPNSVQLIWKERRGKVFTFVVEGDSTEFEQCLQRSPTYHVSVQAIPFEGLFRVLMQREGYARDAILLS